MNSQTQNKIKVCVRISGDTEKYLESSFFLRVHAVADNYLGKEFNCLD